MCHPGGPFRVCARPSEPLCLGGLGPASAQRFGVRLYQVTGTVTVSETTPSSNRVSVAVVNATSTTVVVHISLGHVGVGGSGAGSSVSMVNTNWPFRGVGSGPVVPATLTIGRHEHGQQIRPLCPCVGFPPGTTPFDLVPESKP